MPVITKKSQTVRESGGAGSYTMNQQSPNKELNCFRTGNILGIATCLAFAGITPVPLKRGGYEGETKYHPYNTEWNNTQYARCPHTEPMEIRTWVEERFKDADGVGILCGEISGVIGIDIDDPEKFNEFYPLERLINQASWVIKSKKPGRYHVYLPYRPEFGKGWVLSNFGFELKRDRLCLNFQTKTPNEYAIIKMSSPRPVHVPEFEKKLLNLLMNPSKHTQSPKEETENPDILEIIELASEVYREGCRHDWTIYTAGLLRKLGFSFENTEKALIDFLGNQGDGELSMRIAGIRHTYEKPLDNVKGLSGLLGLELSDESYLRLKSLEEKITKGQGLKLVHICEVMAKEVQEPSWLIPELLPEGFSILGGKPKVGKSWLALYIALKSARSGKNVVYFALEDTDARLKSRLKFLGLSEIEVLNLPWVFSFKLSRIGKGAIKELKDCIQRSKPDLIIIDPWAKVKPQIKGKDPFLEEYQILDIFRDIQKEGPSILLIHHARKTRSDDPLDEILGSTGQTAAVDNILVLKRERNSQTAILHLIPRDFESAELELRFEKGWRIEGIVEKGLMLAEEQKKIVEAVKNLEKMGEEATIKNIAQTLKKNSGAVKVALSDLTKKGVVIRKRRGVYSLPNTKEEKKTTNLTNFTNLPNLTNLLSDDPSVSEVKSG